MSSSSDLEWRLRAWLSSVPPARIARALSYVPLLITPPLMAIGLVWYLRRREGGERISDAEATSIQLISVLNICLSLLLMTAIASYLAGAFPMILDALRSLLGTSAPANGGVISA